MNIDPKQIARMISEDPDVAPDDHFDDTEDEFGPTYAPGWGTPPAPGTWQVGRFEDGILSVYFSDGHGIELEIVERAYNRHGAEDLGIPLDVLDKYEYYGMADHTNYGAWLARFLQAESLPFQDEENNRNAQESAMLNTRKKTRPIKIAETAGKHIRFSFNSYGDVTVYIDGKKYIYNTDAIYHKNWKKMTKRNPFSVLNDIKDQIKRGYASQIYP